MSTFRIRGEPIYVSTEVFRYLKLLAQHTVNESGDSVASTSQIADNILRKAISEEHPELIEFQSEIEEVEQRMKEKIQKRL